MSDETNSDFERSQSATDQMVWRLAQLTEQVKGLTKHLREGLDRIERNITGVVSDVEALDERLRKLEIAQAEGNVKFGAMVAVGSAALSGGVSIIVWLLTSGKLG